jgi:hypothetical protein
MNEPRYSICSSWTNDVQTPAVLGVRLMATVDRLKQVDPAIGHWWTLDMPKDELIPFDDVRPRIAQFVAANVRMDDFGQPCPSDGYGSVLGGALEASEESLLVYLRINGGSIWDNVIDFNIGQSLTPPDYSRVTFEAYRGALEVFAAEWPCPWLLADGFLYDRNGPGIPYQDAWFAYLSPALSAGLIPSTELVVERTSGGGMILAATRELFDPANSDHMRRSEILQAILLDRVGATIEDQWRHPARIGPY